MIIINGIKIEGNGVHNIRVNGSTVTVNGNIVGSNFSGSIEVRVTEGDVANIEADGSVTAGNVTGNVAAGGSVRCENVGGDVSAGGSVKAEAIQGNISAGGSVKVR